MIFENIFPTFAVGVIGFFLFLMLLKTNGPRVDGKRSPPSLPFLPLLYALIRGGLVVFTDYLMQSAEKLGPVFCIKLGRRKIVFINGKEAIYDAFVRKSEDFADRPKLWVENNLTNPSGRGIIFANYSDFFKKNRKLSLSILKEFGFGQSTVMETKILEEVGWMNEEFRKQNGHSINPKHLFGLSASRVVFKMLFDKKFVSLTKEHDNIVESVDLWVKNHNFIYNIIPWLRFLPAVWKQHMAMKISQDRMFASIDEGIKLSKETDSDSTFVKRFIEIQGPNMNEEDLRFIIRDICLASAETVSTTLLWAMVELANHPHVLSRLQKEIDDWTPEHRLPSLEDKPRLPYLEAVTLEVMRRRTIVPLSAPHATLKDTEALGFWFPKDCVVFMNIYSVHMDPQIWKDPMNFRPERFLNEDNKIVDSDKVISFSLGKRSCLGEILGRQQLFLFLSSIASAFDILPPEGQNSIKVQEVFGGTVVPSPFEVRLIERKKRH